MLSLRAANSEGSKHPQAPERNLHAAVVIRAMDDLRNYLKINSYRKSHQEEIRRHKDSAVNWFYSRGDHANAPISFKSSCAVLEMDPSAVLSVLIEEGLLPRLDG